jgi:phytoene/squalene synthetase
MTQAVAIANSTAPRRRLRRLPFVVALMLGLLLSLVHCAGDLAFARADGVVTIGSDSGDAPDVPDQQLPAHSGHCLSHVTAQLAQAAISLAELHPRAPAFGAEQVPPALASPSPFKPPRS